MEKVGTKSYFCRVSTYQPGELQELLSEVSEWRYRAAVILSRKDASDFPDLYLLDEDLLNLDAAILFQENLAVAEKFNRIIVRAIESGLIEHWEGKKRYKFEEVNKINQLTLNHLEYLFHLLNIGLLFVSTPPFIFELTFDAWKQSDRGKRHKHLNETLDKVYDFIAC